MPIIVFVLCFWGLEWSLPASLLVAILADMEPNFWRGFRRKANSIAREKDSDV